MKFAYLFFLIPLILFSQNQKKNVEIDSESGEPFILVDKNWINQIEDENSSFKGYDKNLSLNLYQNRFNLLNSNTELSIDYNAVTFNYVKKYLSYSWYYKIIGLSVFYFPLFEAVLSKYGVPKEVKYLAVVESALNPRAGSSAGAAGIWQFMPVTGRQFGLQSNPYYSDFYDVVKSTDAAARYLKNLYKNLGDWNLAISAYNCGEGNVRKAIKKAGTKNYWQVRKFLPKETQAYVPSFIAVNYMFNFYKEHGIKPIYFKYNFFDIRKIRNKQITSFQNLGGDINFLRFANPQFITDIIPANSIIYTK